MTEMRCRRCGQTIPPSIPLWPDDGGLYHVIQKAGGGFHCGPVELVRA